MTNAALQMFRRKLAWSTGQQGAMNFTDSPEQPIRLSSAIDQSWLMISSGVLLPNIQPNIWVHD